MLDTWEKGLELFLLHILQPPIRDHLVSAILKQVHIEREGFVINRSAVKGCVDVFVSLETGEGPGQTVYKCYLEPSFLKESEAFYRGEGMHLLTSCDAPQFLRRVSVSLFSGCHLKSRRLKHGLTLKIREHTIIYRVRHPYPFGKY